VDKHDPTKGGKKAKHPNFYLFATANTMGMGATSQFLRKKQDGAFMDRFSFIPMNYDPQLEKNMVDECAWEFVEVNQKVRQANEEAGGAEFGFVISPRASEKAMDFLRPIEGRQPMRRDFILDMIWGAYRKHEKWPHIGRAAEEWARRDPLLNGKPNLSSINFTGTR